jgi:hypothetical protein
MNPSDCITLKKEYNSNKPGIRNIPNIPFQESNEPELPARNKKSRLK